MDESLDNADPSLAACVLLGTAVGDALGLKGEGLGRSAARKLDWDRPWLFGRAVLSDDTEQSFLVAQALLAAHGDVEVFRRRLRRSLIGWLFAGPPGVGLGTVRSILKLALGGRRGVATAGNGAAMRSAVIGAFYADDPARIEAFVRASTDLTHADERAFVGALAVALAASARARGEAPVDALGRLREVETRDAELWNRAMAELVAALERGDSVEAYAAALGCERGVTGYVYHTVPVALYAWARHDDPEEGLRAVWRCGGDTDSVGAIAGALLYARAGRVPPAVWVDSIVDRPLSVARLEAAARALTRGGAPVRWLWPLLPLRNVLVVFPLVLAYAVFVMVPRKLRG